MESDQLYGLVVFGDGWGCFHGNRSRFGSQLRFAVHEILTSPQQNLGLSREHDLFSSDAYFQSCLSDMPSTARLAPSKAQNMAAFTPSVHCTTPSQSFANEAGSKCGPVLAPIRRSEKTSYPIQEQSFWQHESDRSPSTRQS